jgi:hypothetical protein
MSLVRQMCHVCHMCHVRHVSRPGAWARVSHVSCASHVSHIPTRRLGSAQWARVPHASHVFKARLFLHRLLLYCFVLFFFGARLLQKQG